MRKRWKEFAQHRHPSMAFCPESKGNSFLVPAMIEHPQTGCCDVPWCLGIHEPASWQRTYEDAVFRGDCVES